MKRFVFAATVVAGLGVIGSHPAAAQGCAGGMCGLPGAANQQQAAPGTPMQQATPGMPMMGGGMGMMGMCGCCQQMAMMQPNVQGGLRPMPDDGGMGSTPRPPAAPGGEPAPGGTPPAQ
jgi:hypothetical protein